MELQLPSKQMESASKISQNTTEAPRKSVKEMTEGSVMGKRLANIGIRDRKMNAEEKYNSGMEKARKIYYRAIHQCPWSKQLWLDGIRWIGGLLDEEQWKGLLRLMIQKDIRIREIVEGLEDNRPMDDSRENEEDEEEENISNQKKENGDEKTKKEERVQEDQKIKEITRLDDDTIKENTQETAQYQKLEKESGGEHAGKDVKFKTGREIERKEEIVVVGIGNHSVSGNHAKTNSFSHLPLPPSLPHPPSFPPPITSSNLSTPTLPIPHTFLNSYPNPPSLPFSASYPQLPNSSNHFLGPITNTNYYPAFPPVYFQQLTLPSIAVQQVPLTAFPLSTPSLRQCATDMKNSTNVSLSSKNINTNM